MKQHNVHLLKLLLSWKSLLLSVGFSEPQTLSYTTSEEEDEKILKHGLEISKNEVLVTFLGPTDTMGNSDTGLAVVINSQCLWRQSLCPAQFNPGVPDLAQSSTAYGHLSIAKGKFHFT